MAGRGSKRPYCLWASKPPHPEPLPMYPVCHELLWKRGWRLGEAPLLGMLSLAMPLLQRLWQQAGTGEWWLIN